MSVFSRLHEKLKIPDRFYIAETQAKPLNSGVRAAAIRELRGRNELLDRDDTEALLEALCRRFQGYANEPGKFHNRWIGNKPRVRPKAQDADEKRAARLARSTQIREALIQDPNAKARPLAERFDCDESTIRLYRRQLRHEGLIP